MDAVEEIKSRLAIEDVIGEYVQLKRAGRNYKGLSPFTNEKTPSFVVSPEKQIWHDFSSNKGGDMFSFVMETEGLDFKAALDLLARKAGLDLSQYKTEGGSSNAKLKERLYSALEQAAKFYQVQFSKNQKALEYIFKKRQFSKEIALGFRIGYSPNTGTALVSYLKKQGFSDGEMQKAGLTAKRYRDLSDMFRGRIMIPLTDSQGRVIGFTARILEDDVNAPKYINTPQTILYDKSRHVFGLNLAKETIRKLNYVVVAEGNLDVIASHQAGVKQVVATAGTAMTEMHLKTLARFTTDIRLAFDQDRAGLAAAERAIPLASKTGVSLSIITIPSGKDPDELIKKDPGQWLQVIEKQQYALDWLINRYEAQLDIGTAEGKRRFSDVLLPVIRQLSDSVEQDHYVNKISDLLGIKPEAIRIKFAQTITNNKPLKRTKLENSKAQPDDAELIRFQDHLLALLLMRPPLRYYLKSLKPEMLATDLAREIVAFLNTNEDFLADDVEAFATFFASKPAEVVQRLQDYVKILRLQFEELYQGLELLELRNEATRLQARVIEHYVKVQKQRLAENMRSASDAKQTELLEQAKELDQLLKSR